MTTYELITNKESRSDLYTFTVSDIKLLQEILEVKVDGIFGIESITKLNSLDDASLWDQFYTAKYNKFINGKKYEINRILDACISDGITDYRQGAYVLATVKKETNSTFEPVVEAYWLSDSWRRRNLRYYPYYGRGFVQITWKSNYKKFEKILDMDLTTWPDVVLDITISSKIMTYGMANGTFTGKKLSDYINETKCDYVNARRIINGTDKAKEIAGYAEMFEPYCKRYYEYKIT